MTSDSCLWLFIQKEKTSMRIWFSCVQGSFSRNDAVNQWLNRDFIHLVLINTHHFLIHWLKTTHSFVVVVYYFHRVQFFMHYLLVLAIKTLIFSRKWFVDHQFYYEHHQNYIRQKCSKELVAYIVKLVVYKSPFIFNIWL